MKVNYKRTEQEEEYYRALITVLFGDIAGEQLPEEEIKRIIEDFVNNTVGIRSLMGIATRCEIIRESVNEALIREKEKAAREAKEKQITIDDFMKKGNS